MYFLDTYAKAKIKMRKQMVIKEFVLMENTLMASAF